VRQGSTNTPRSMEAGATLADDASHERLKRNTDGNARASGIAAIVQVISVVDVHHVNVVSLIPVGSPEFRVRINNAKPIAAVLESWKSANFHKGKVVHTERVSRTIVAAEIGVRDAVTGIAAALLPCAVFGIEVMRAPLLPFASLLALLGDLLLLRASLLNRLIRRPLGNLLSVLGRFLLRGVLRRIRFLLLLLRPLLRNGFFLLLLCMLLRG